MSATADFESALALSRFGLGSGVDGVSAVSNARDSLHQEITQGAPTPQNADLKTTSELLAELYVYQQEKKDIRKGKADTPRPGMSGAATEPTDMSMSNAGKPKKDKPDFNPIRDATLTEADARFNGTIKSPAIGFNERLVMFWANHFAVAVKKSQPVAITAGAYEREAIRPHIFGRFADLLLAAETHPCMLDYLDNQQSIGPESPANRKGTRGLNENLAREIMELHTLGVSSGYTQADVTAFAKVITGWTFSRSSGSLKGGRTSGTFAFNKQAHEPGPQTILGKTYPDTGFDQGKAVLLDLAHHPATAQHIATKLARHFVADDPPPALVARLADTFRRTDGDLGAVSTALIEAKESWTPQLTRFRSPLLYLSALIRSTDIRMKPVAITQTLNNMGQPNWQPSGPNGFPDTMAAWASPEGLSTRLDVANVLADRADPGLDPREFVRSRLGALLSDHTRDAVARAETRVQGLSLVFLSPEFMRC